MANSYITLAAFKSYARIASTSADTDDDDVIETLIESTSRLIDAETGRVWYPSTDDHLFDLPTRQELILDDDCQSVTAVTNGDGTLISSSDYVVLPANKSPKFGIVLKAPNIWLPDNNGNGLQCITVSGTWGQAAPTADIVYACKAIAHAAYKRRFGENVSATTTITAAGVVVEPQDIPETARKILLNNRRITFA